MFISTPSGVGNTFFKLFGLGLDPNERDWGSWQFPTATNPYIDAIEIEAERKSLVLVPGEGHKKVAGVPLSQHQRAVLETLAQPLWLTVGAQAAQLADIFPTMTRGALYRVLNALLERKFVSQ